MGILSISHTGKRIIRNAAYLAFGSIFGRAAMFIVFVLVARYFGPDDFGKYNAAFNHVFLFGLFSILGLEMTVIREGAKKPEELIIIQNKIFPVRFWFSIGAWLFTVITAFLIDYDDVTIKLIILLSPLVLTGGAISSGMIEHFTTYFRVIEKMQYEAYVVLFRTVIFTIIVGCLLLFRNLNLANLSVVVVISSVLALFFQFRQAQKLYPQSILFRIDYNYLKPLIQPILLFGVVSILSQLSLRLNISMLSKLSNNTQTGYYSAAWNIVSIGIMFIASFSISFFPNSSRSIFSRSFRNKMLKGLIYGSIIFIAAGLFTVIFAENITQIIYGKTYLESAKVLAITIWFLPIRFLSLWGHQVLESANYLVLRVIIFLILTIVNIILNFRLIPQYGAVGSAYASLISNLLILLFAVISGLYIIKRDERFQVQNAA